MEDGVMMGSGRVIIPTHDQGMPARRKEILVKIYTYELQNNA